MSDTLLHLYNRTKHPTVFERNPKTPPNPSTAGAKGMEKCISIPFALVLLWTTTYGYLFTVRVIVHSTGATTAAEGVKITHQTAIPETLIWAEGRSAERAVVDLSASSVGPAAVLTRLPWTSLGHAVDTDAPTTRTHSRETAKTPTTTAGTAAATTALMVCAFVLPPTNEALSSLSTLVRVRENIALLTAIDSYSCTSGRSA